MIWTAVISVTASFVPHVGVVTGSLTSIDGAYVSAAPCLLRPPVQAF